MVIDLDLDSYIDVNTLHMPMDETIQSIQGFHEAIQRAVEVFTNIRGKFSEEEDTFALEELTESKELTDFLSEMAIKKVC